VLVVGSKAKSSGFDMNIIIVVTCYKSGRVSDGVCYDDTKRTPKDFLLLVLVLRSTLGFHGQESVRLESQYLNRCDRMENVKLIRHLVRQETMYFYRGFALPAGSIVDSS
jgi:hypothetical protein